MANTIIQNVLIVDDKPENLLALESILDKPNIRLIKAESGDQALWLLLKHEISLIILDVQMPGIDGFETARLIKQREATKNIPIVFLTALSKGIENSFKGYNAGAIDYLVKPIAPDILKTKVEAILKTELQRKILMNQTKKLHDFLEKTHPADQIEPDSHN